MGRAASLRCILLVFCMGAPYFSFAQTLSERQIYERCSARLTRSTPIDSDPFASKVSAGKLKGTEACKQLLALGKLDTNGKIIDHNNSAKQALGEKILSSMNDLHVSWMTNKTFNALSFCRGRATIAAVDPQEPAMFFTRALLAKNVPYSYVTRSTDNLRAIRSVNNPISSIVHIKIQKLEGFPANFRMPGNGKLLGISNGYDPKVATMTAVVRAQGESRTPASSNEPVLRNKGGGIIGSQAYLLNNVGDAGDIFPDLEKMHRNWSKYVFKDLLCRELPVIYEGDADNYAVCADKKKCGIQPKAKENVLSFRKEASCVQCHATMDQLLGVTRNLRAYRSGRCNFNDGVLGTFHWLSDKPTLAKKTGWGYTADPDYYKRAPSGRLVFRDIYGKLVNEEISSYQDIGEILAKKDDMYICAAKRYYQYFTGIDVDLSIRPSEASKLPADQQFYRSQVIKLGQSLRDPKQYNQSTQKLIEAIFDLPEYKQRDFRLVEKARGNK